MIRRFVNYRYDAASKRLVFEWMNTFVRRAIGFQTRWFFVGILIAHEMPPHRVVLTDQTDE